VAGRDEPREAVDGVGAGVAADLKYVEMVTRTIAKRIDPVQLQTISGVQASVILVPAALLLPDVPGFGIMVPDGRVVVLLWALGGIGTVAHLMMTWSLRYAPASTLAPMQYLEIPFGTLIGWLIFQDLPNGLAALGIVITMAAGLYIIVREQRLSRRSDVSLAGSPEPAHLSEP